MLCLRIFVLITLRTILNAIICCLQLNTGRGADANPKVDFLGIDACWIAVYVLCRNALIKSHNTYHIMYVHCYALSICQLPDCNLFTQHAIYLMGKTPLVNCGPRSYSLHRIQSTAILVLLFSANNHLPHNTVNPLLQQAGEIDNLTVSLGQSTLVVLCRFHVGAGIPGVAPHYIPPPSTFNVLLGSSWFDKPWFLSEGKLAAVRIIPSSWGSQRTCELHAIKHIFWRRCRGSEEKLHHRELPPTATSIFSGAV